MKASERLRRAKARLLRPGSWVQGAYAENAQRDAISPILPSATCYCMVGSLMVEGTAPEWDVAIEYLARAVKDELTIAYNDTPGRLHRDILAAFDRAITLAEAEKR